MTNAEARCNKSLRPRKPEGSLGRTAQDVHLDSHTAPELWALRSATLVVLVCVGSLANHVSMVEDFKQRAFEDCRVTLGDTKDSLQGVSVVSDVTGRVRVSVCGV